MRIVNRWKCFVERRQGREQRQQRYRWCRFDDQAIAFLAPDYLLAWELGFHMNMQSQIPFILETLDVCLIRYRGFAMAHH